LDIRMSLTFVDTAVSGDHICDVGEVNVLLSIQG